MTGYHQFHAVTVAVADHPQCRAPSDGCTTARSIPRPIVRMCPSSWFRCAF
jgi:hypothetical protein